MKQKPNIIIITTHDSGRHFGCYGVPTVRTPNIDKLATEGVKFDNMNAACPICSPSRGALLTGQYPQTNGLVGLAGGSWNWELHDYKVHLSHRLHDLGYTTGMFGLQHDTVFLDKLGFDKTEAHGIKKNGTNRSATIVAKDVVEFLENYDYDQPFYAQVGFHETHTVYNFADCQPDDAKGVWIPPYSKSHFWVSWESILKRFGGDPSFSRQHVAELQGSLHEVDNAVGMITEALCTLGLEENTLILFNTDHGPELPGAKWTMYDAGLGIGFVMRWPAGGIDGGCVNDWLLCNVDFLPTLFDLIGEDKPSDLQGISFAEGCIQYKSATPSPRKVAFGNWVDGLNFSARTDRFKLIRNLVPVDSTGRKCPPYELYDLSIDPLELTDVANEPAYTEDFKEMKSYLDKHLLDQNDPVATQKIVGEDHNAMLADYRQKYEAMFANQ
jgi:N-sulfoglucosamine sulfohydrolase